HRGDGVRAGEKLRVQLRGPAPGGQPAWGDEESRKSRRVRQRGDNPEVVRAAVIAVFALALASSNATAGSGSGSGKSARASRRPNPRTGRLAPAFAELVKAHKRGDQAALARVADRMGLVRLADAIGSNAAGVGEAALTALPLARGGV